MLNYDFNKRKVEMYNIFNNIKVQEHAEKAVKKYLRNPQKYTYLPFGKNVEPIYGFNALTKEIDGIIRWEEWGRREYEVSVGDAFESNINKLEKWDCYMQAKPNMEIITREIIYQYKKQLKEKKETEDIKK